MEDPALERLNAALDGRYRIERELGAGGMATVYLAHDERHDRKVAIKVLKPELAAVVGAERFLAEIRTTANLQHPHILPLHDSGEADGFLFYVMPYVEGESLRERLDRETQLPIPEAVAIVRKVAAALQAAHDQGVVHRDIKPANILLANGEPLVADFGIALAVQHAGGGRLTETGLSLGTPHYMSPEQAAADRAPDARSDLYSLGCVLYEMLTGEPPFTGPTAQAVVARLLSTEPPPVTDLRKTVPPHVAAATHTALQKLPADRFASAGEMAAALGDERAGTTAAMHGAAVPSSATRRRAALVPWAIAVVAIGALAATLLTSQGDGPAAETHRTVRVVLPPFDPPVRGPLTISRDGRHIVYVGGRANERNHLVVRSLDDPESHVLSGTDNPEDPSISRDGRWIGYWADGAIRKVPIEGGQPITMYATPNRPRGTSWTPGGDLVLGMFTGPTVRESWQAGLSLLRDVPGAEPDSLIPAEDMHHDPVVVDGGTVLFYTFPAEGSGVEVAAGSLETGGWRALGLRGVPVGVADGILLYRQGPTLFAVRWDPEGRGATGASVVVPRVPDGLFEAALAEDGTLVLGYSEVALELVVADVSGGAEVLLPGETVDEVTPRFSPDGRRVALGTNLRGVRELWMYVFGTRALSQLDVGFDPHTVAWSADGMRVIAGPNQGRNVLWTVPADASADPEVLLELSRLGRRGIAGVEPSPDGRTLAVTKNMSEVFGIPTRDIVVVPTDDPQSETPIATSDADERFPRFSPDGEWIAYTSDATGRMEVYLSPSAGGARVEVTEEGGTQPVWGSDGRRLFYLTNDSARMMEVSIVRDAAGGVSAGERRELFRSDVWRGGPSATSVKYDVAPDGRFLFARPAGDARSGVAIWIDWMHELDALLDGSDG